MRPQLNFGFHLVSGYFGRMSLKHYQGAGHRFIVMIRVTPDEPDKKPTYLSQYFDLPKIPDKSSSQIEMDGAFFVGEGGYQVDWLISDRSGQTCRKKWHIQAKLSHGDRSLSLSLAPGSVAPLRYEAWKGVNPDNTQPLRLALYVHVAPLSMRRLKLHPYDQTLLLSSILSLLDRTPFTSIKVVAYNVDQQKEIFRENEFTPAGWDNLIDAVSHLDLVTVPVSVLAKRSGHLDMIRGYFDQELSAEQPADAVVFLGPSSRKNEKLRFEAGEHRTRFYYFEYKPYWARGSEYPDVISHAVHALAGKTFHIYSPHDLLVALRDVREVVTGSPCGAGW